MISLIREHKFITVCVIIAVIAVTVILTAVLRTDEEKIAAQEKSIRQTIEERALQCYVIEDAYPESLSYLEENYGLAVNQEDYKVVYTPFAENLPPAVEVIYRGNR